MSVSEELLLRISVEGGTAAAAEADAVTVSVDRMEASTGRATKSAGGLFRQLKALSGLFAGMAVLEAVKQYASFQSTMERLQTQTGATHAEVVKATKGVLGMAVSVGTGPNSLAQAMYHIESAGYRGKTALDALRIAAEGAKVGNAELVDTTTGLTAVLVAGYGKGKNAIQQLQHAMGQLNATVGAGDMTFQDLNEALGTGILSTFKVLGLQVNDLGAALAVLGDNNIRGAMAATRLRMSLMTLVRPSSTAADAMHAIHLGTYQLAEDLRKPNGLLVMLKDLSHHLEGLTDTQKASTLAAIFGGGRNSAAMLTLLDQMDRLKSKYDAVNSAGNSFNKDWQDTTKTLSFFIDQAKALGEVVLIKLGKAISVVATGIKDFTRGLRENKPWAVAIAGALMGIGAALLYLNAETIAAKFAFLSLEEIPIVALFAAIGVAVLLLVTHFKEVKRWVSEAAKVIAGAFLDAWHWVEQAAERVWKVIKKIFDFMTGKGGTISKIFSYLNPVGQASHLLGLGKGLLHGIGSLLGLAGGGNVTSGGAFVVGESGPEVVYLPAGAAVQPNRATAGSGEGVPLEATIVNYTVLDGKVTSRSVVRQALMAQARRGVGGPTIVDAGAGA